MWHDSCTYVTWLIHMWICLSCGGISSFTRKVLFTWHDFIYVTCIRDMTHLFVWHDLFIYGIWVCRVTYTNILFLHSYTRNDIKWHVMYTRNDTISRVWMIFIHIWRHVMYSRNNMSCIREMTPFQMIIYEWFSYIYEHTATPRTPHLGEMICYIYEKWEMTCHVYEKWYHF